MVFAPSHLALLGHRFENPALNPSALNPLYEVAEYSFVTFLLGAPLWAAPSRPMPICGRPKPPGRPRLSVADPASRGMAAVRWWIGGLHIFGLCVYSCNVFGVQFST